MWLGHSLNSKTSCVGKKRPPKIEIRWQYYHKYYYVDFNFSKRLVPAQQENWPFPRLRVESFSSSCVLKRREGDKTFIIITRMGSKERCLSFNSLTRFQKTQFWSPHISICIVWAVCRLISTDIVALCLLFFLQPFHCTEVCFASFLSGGFTTMSVINPPERKQAKHTYVQWFKANRL